MLDFRVSLSAAPDISALYQGGPTGCWLWYEWAFECMLGYWGGWFDWQSFVHVVAKLASCAGAAEAAWQDL